MPSLDLPLIHQASENLRDVVWKTPFEPSPVLKERTGTEVFLKAECLQRTGSFKLRGAYNRISLITEAEKSRGIVTASAGNHAQGVGYAAQKIALPARVFVPEIIPDNKLEAIKRYPVEIVIEGKLYDAAHEAAMRDAEESNRVYIEAFDDPLIMAGHGTVGLEMMSQVPDLDAVLVPVGGGGLICGMATALKALNPNLEVIGCQSTASCAMTKSLEENQPYLTYPSKETIAEGLEGGIGMRTFELGQRLIDRMVLVEEDEIRSAIRFLLEYHRLVVEGSGAVGVAALLFGRLTAPGKKIGVVLSGGNLEYSLLIEIVSEGRC